MTDKKIIEKTKVFVKKILKNQEAGHDYWHSIRVLNNARKIAKEYDKIDLLSIELTALLHDIPDRKFNEKKEDNILKIRGLLVDLGIEEHRIGFIFRLIDKISFSSEQDENFRPLELLILQDADRLDAIGAIGIARAFSYGGYKQREMYNPEIQPKLNLTKDEYKKHISTTINHFYEKLLLLKDMMNTPQGRRLAEKRHSFMLEFLDNFFDEWE